MMDCLIHSVSNTSYLEKLSNNAIKFHILSFEKEKLPKLEMNCEKQKNVIGCGILMIILKTSYIICSI